MATYIRKTRDEYQVQGDYGYGWEYLTAEATRGEALVMKRCYDQNEPGIPHRVKTVRVRKEC